MWTSGAVGVLALAVLLVDSGAGLPEPKMTVNAVKDSEYDFAQAYGTDLIIHCSSKNSSKLRITPGQILQVNSTTVELRVVKPNTGLHEFTCVDSETFRRNDLFVKIVPAMSVRAPKVTGEDGVKAEYFVRRGDKYQVYCTAHAAKSLRIFSDWFRVLELKTKVVNETTIEISSGVYSEKVKSYFCFFYIHMAHNMFMYNKVDVKVGYDPQVEDFRCLILNMSILECSWREDRHDDSHNGSWQYELTLIHNTDKRDARQLCCQITDKIHPCQCNIGWITSAMFILGQTIPLSLNICDFKTMFCNKQEFHIETSNAITKSEPVRSFEVTHTSSHGVLLKWQYPYNRLLDYVRIYETLYKMYEYKLEYRLITGEEGWRQVDLSAAQLRYRYNKYTFNVANLVPDTRYELRIFAKLMEAKDERLWSEPSHISVQTKPKEVCNCKEEHQIPGEYISCKLCKLINDVIDKNLAFKNILEKSLKVKKSKIKDISNFLAVKNAVAKKHGI